MPYDISVQEWPERQIERYLSYTPCSVSSDMFVRTEVRVALPGRSGGGPLGLVVLAYGPPPNRIPPSGAMNELLHVFKSLSPLNCSSIYLLRQE